jgi:hypothetical protein
VPLPSALGLVLMLLMLMLMLGYSIYGLIQGEQ